jgi:hypothetical protein
VHCDPGPHVPRPAGVEWDDRIPYPVFAIGAHVMLRDCPVVCGPTAVVAGRPEAIERAVTRRQRRLVGLHDPYSYEG